jgi:hypothetical protein
VIVSRFSRQPALWSAAKICGGGDNPWISSDLAAMRFDAVGI